MLAASTLRAGLHKQDSGIINSYLFIVSGISNCLHNETKMNPNERAVYIIPISKTKCIVILTPKYNIKLLKEKYK